MSISASALVVVTLMCVRTHAQHPGSFKPFLTVFAILVYASLDVKCTPYYYYSSSSTLLKSIDTKLLNAESGSTKSYEITYSYSISGEPCHSTTTTCNGKEVMDCSHRFDIYSSSCPNATDINVTVMSTDSTDSWTSEPIKIDGENKFVKISFDKTATYTSITCTFINQQRKTKKSCIVKYGSGHDCAKRKFTLGVEGTLANSNSISLELHGGTSTICFNIEASNGTKVVNVIGSYDGGTVSAKNYYSSLMVLIIIIVYTGAVVILTYITSYKKKARNTGEIDLSYIEHRTDITSSREGPWKPVDLSITFFKLLKVTEFENQILMYKFIAEQFKHCQPQDGFGYYKITNEEIQSTQLHKKMLVLDDADGKQVPVAATFTSVVQHKNKTNPEHVRNVYVQDRSFTRKLASGTEVLFCALSKEPMSYHEIYNVAEKCKESVFVAKNIPGYKKEWIRYGYFELTCEEYIKPYQRVIVMKKDGTLVTGPGVRHLVGAVGDGSEKTRPPDMSEHKEWKNIFIQSRGDDRDLQPGTEYLFCAMMDKVRAHYTVYDVHTSCNMAEFGAEHIPGFKPELGYGYYEFTQKEFFKPHKKVILVHKNNKLYTGAGAQFLCIEGQYNEDIKLGKDKISPPKLANTEWKHIFIQSHSNDRKLLPGTKFLYCEYKTYK